MAQIGNKINSALNGEWGKHVRGFFKKRTSRLRRQEGQSQIRKEVSDAQDKWHIKRVMGNSYMFPGSEHDPIDY